MGEWVNRGAYRMKSYLEACNVPTVMVGEVEVPRLIMGLHPFDGYGYVSAERDRANLRVLLRWPAAGCLERRRSIMS